MKTFNQSPTDPDFVQNPYPAYTKARKMGDVVYWADYKMAATVSHAATRAVLTDRRFGRTPPAEKTPARPNHTAAWQAVEDHSMLELEPPRHTRLRGLVLRAFTSRRIASLGPDIHTLADELIDNFPKDSFDFLTHFAQPLPVRIIARLLGVPEDMSPQLLSWSNAMVAMYQSGRDKQVEDAANTAALDFSDFLRKYIEARRTKPADDLITQLITAEEGGKKLTPDEMISTCILLLNAGHEATVHTLGNGLWALKKHNIQKITDPVIEEIMRFDPPLHIFTRWASEDIVVEGHTICKGQEIACVLGAANHDPKVFNAPTTFDTTRTNLKSQLAFGAGLHFCVGAPLARLELSIALTKIMERTPSLHLSASPQYSDTYHFHGLKALLVKN